MLRSLERRESSSTSQNFPTANDEFPTSKAVESPSPAKSNVSVEAEDDLPF